MPNHVPIGERENAPLAVCINDCKIDFGQHQSELVEVCFLLGCAFAEMRWGRPDNESSDPVPLFSQKTCPLTLARDQG